MNALNLESVSKCKRCVTLGSDYCPSEGSNSADIFIIGQSPGENEVNEGRPFCGPSGEILDFMLDEAGLDRAQVYIANALKCRPPSNRAGNPEELVACFKQWLSHELMQVNPAIVVLVGRDAWQSVTHGKIPFKHGLVTQGKNRKYLTVYHPAYFLRRGDVEAFIAVGKTLRELHGHS